MFAAASDTAVGIVVECKAVFQNYSMFTFDVTSANTRAWEDELVFVEQPQEEIEEHENCSWRLVMVIYGRRKGARSWHASHRRHHQERRGQAARHHCGRAPLSARPSSLIELHVDDGHRCGKEGVIAELLASL